MTSKCFVDTNILVYARDAGAGIKHEQADALLRELWDSRTGRISIQVLNEYFVTVTRKLKPGISPTEAWRDIELLKVWEPIPLNWQLLEKGRQIFTHHSLPWWDSLIIAAADLADARILYSEDLQPNSTYGDVTVLNPFGKA